MLNTHNIPESSGHQQQARKLRGSTTKEMCLHSGVKLKYNNVISTENTFPHEEEPWYIFDGIVLYYWVVTLPRKALPSDDQFA